MHFRNIKVVVHTHPRTLFSVCVRVVSVRKTMAILHTVSRRRRGESKANAAPKANGNWICKMRFIITFQFSWIYPSARCSTPVSVRVLLLVRLVLGLWFSRLVLHEEMRDRGCVCLALGGGGLWWAILSGTDINSWSHALHLAPFSTAFVAWCQRHWKKRRDKFSIYDQNKSK